MYNIDDYETLIIMITELFFLILLNPKHMNKFLFLKFTINNNK